MIHFHDTKGNRVRSIAHPDHRDCATHDAVLMHREPETWPWYDRDAKEWPESIAHNLRVAVLYRGPYPMCGWGLSQWDKCQVAGFITDDWR